ncbi:MAG: hypothetical protein M1838_003403 [Thelocarpon superellum]|nr:MAG: hypothetical protein M1838_003403 [Thelocarpon superellum]
MAKKPAASQGYVLSGPNTPVRRQSVSTADDAVTVLAATHQDLNKKGPLQSMMANHRDRLGQPSGHVLYLRQDQRSKKDGDRGLGVDEEKQHESYGTPSIAKPPTVARRGEEIGLISDAMAAANVAAYFSGPERSAGQRTAERELIRAMGTSPFCEPQIHDVIKWADELFFQKKLQSRVEWRWSDDVDPCAVATTGLRRLGPGRFRAQITLSQPVLQSGRYDQRLLIAAILHEAIHSYLIICCGVDATLRGGHPPGFVQIAQLIDEWVDNRHYLHLSDIRAKMEHFELETPPRAAQPRPVRVGRHAAPRRGRACA